MINTNLKSDNIPISFDNPRALLNYMEKNGISSVKATSCIGIREIFTSIMDINDVRKWVKMNDED